MIPAIERARLGLTPVSRPTCDAATNLVLTLSAVQAEGIAQLLPTILTAPTFIAYALLWFAWPGTFLGNALPVALFSVAILLASPVVNVAGVTCPAFLTHTHAVLTANAIS